MKIAVPTNDGTSISEHFGRSAAFLIFEAGNGKITSRETRTNGAQHEHTPGACDHHSADHQAPSHAGILAALDGCDLVICAGMGQGAADALQAQGIKVVVAAPGPAEQAVTAFLAGQLPASRGSFCCCHN
jgi:predicted Fe-Mo cluster-binding NifX family protein